ncbi:MAG TPA: hypothetical protein VLC93_18485 [Myxococcota bacterium]|nr:hypothetical protein [Myxococcota bacterium]
MRLVLFVALTFIACGAPAGDELDDTCPAAGGLVITELAIRGASYIEFYNTAARAFALEAVSLSVAGSGAARNVEVSGDIAAGRYRALPVTTLADAGGVVAIACDERVIDEVRYGAAKSDVWALDGAKPPDATDNDLAANWCGQAGSAGGANPPCAASVCESGVKPRYGDLLVNEVMRDPEGADAEGEWIELYVAADSAITLDGLEIEEVATSTRKLGIVAPPCFAVEPRTLVLLPLGGDREPRLVRGSGLFNDDAELTLRVDGVVVDRVEIACGRSGTSCAWVDDAWCEATTPTPGEENSCAP